MSRRERITDAGNTLAPVVLALRSLGFTVRREFKSGEERWQADSPDLTFVSDTPLGVLGLVAMRETRGADWKATDEEVERILEEFG